jgi:hypothetical protein
MYCTVWVIVEPTLAPHNREFAANIELLRKSNRKSKEDCQADAKRRTSTRLDDDFFDRHIADLDQEGCDSESDDHSEDFQVRTENFTAETLIAAYHTVRQAWSRELTIAAHRIPALVQRTIQSRNIIRINPRQLAFSTASINDTLGVGFLAPSMLQNWERRLKYLASTRKDDSTAEELNSSFQLYDFDQDIGQGLLQPMLVDSEVVHSRRSQLGENPTAAYLTSLVARDIPLNKKQQFIVIKILSEALAWADHPYDFSRRKQLLLCITGEGGTGKSQIPKAIVAAMDLLGRKDEIMLMAPTMRLRT